MYLFQPVAAAERSRKVCGARTQQFIISQTIQTAGRRNKTTIRDELVGATARFGVVIAPG
jgi:hypothetical protein